MMYRKVLTVFLICAGRLLAVQAGVDSLWTDAQDAYLKNDFGGAALRFEEYLANAPGSFQAMYNLGNCYLQDGNTGKAILWYERAGKIRPFDPDLRHNLSIAKERRKDPVVEIREFFAVRWIKAVSGLLPVKWWGVLSVGLFWILVFVCGWAVRKSAWRSKRWIIVAISVAWVCVLAFAMLRRSDLMDDTAAVVLRDEVEVTIAPDPGSKLVAKINAGEKVLILDSLTQYYKIRLANFEQGWLNKQSVERI
jgi:hypothetical protein